MPSITLESFGRLQDGQRIERYTLTGAGGLSVSILTYGAIVQSLCLDGVDMVLGYDDLEGYVNDNSYQGVSIGRCGNRIAGGKFTLNGQEYILDCNEKEQTHLHGGTMGFGRRVWKAEPLQTEDPALRLHLISPDGDGGYPGTLTTSVTYSVTPDNALHILYTAVCDKDTHYNPSCHAYFNPAGVMDTSALDLILQIRADKYNPVNAALIPEGEPVSVEGTPFDFRVPKPIGRDISAADPQLAIVGGGYDHNFLLTGEQPAVTLHSDRTGITMECFTDQPAVQMYPSTCLACPCGKGGRPMHRFQAVCLETQHVPDTPNQPQYPSTVLKAGERYHSETVYRFIKHD